MANSCRRLRPPSQSLRYVTWSRSSTVDREASPQTEAVRAITCRSGRPTRATNSCQASSSPAPAHRPTTSLRDRDEYRVAFDRFNMLDESPANNCKSRDFTYGDESFWRSGTSWCVTKLLTMSNLLMMFCRHYVFAIYHPKVSDRGNGIGLLESSAARACEEGKGTGPSIDELAL